jgi:hypothetical protein
MVRISASPFPAFTLSPILFPNNALASGETCEIVPREGFASSSAHYTEGLPSPIIAKNGHRATKTNLRGVSRI